MVVVTYLGVKEVFLELLLAANLDYSLTANLWDGLMRLTCINEFFPAVVCPCVKCSSKTVLRYCGAQDMCFYADPLGCDMT